MSFACIENPKRIHFITEDRDKPLTVFNHKNHEQSVEKIIPMANGFEILLKKELDFSLNYYIKQGSQKNWAHPSTALINDKFFFNGDLGAKWTKKNLTLTLWSPTAIAIEVTLFTNNKKKSSSHHLIRKEKGTWQTTIELTTSITYYQYKVTAFGKSNLVLDPYAKSMENYSPNSHPKAALVDHNKTTPTNFIDDSYCNSSALSSESAFIGYEVHVRDFTIDPSSNPSEEEKGTYLGFSHHIDYLKNLGISHVQLLPIQSYCTVDENNRKFQDQNIPSGSINYNWGYDAHHYFIPQGWFSSDSHNPNTRIIEFKKMVLDLHRAGIGVIMDVVYNHLFHESFLENVAPGCYIRRDKQGKISGGTGAGATLESRNLMTQKLIIDSLKYFQDIFHIDGFRFDLMGFLDLNTMKTIRKDLKKETILYGEAWDFTDLPPKIATTKTQVPKGISAFNDSARNSYTGEMARHGFVQGNFAKGPLVRSGIIGGVNKYKTDYDNDGHLDTFIDEFKYHCFADSPLDTINFISIHDGFTLWDKISLSVDTDEITLRKIVRLSLAMLLTSQGKIVLHGGDEIARSKPLATNDPNPDRTEGRKHLESRFHENTYQSPDFTNRFDWKRAKKFDDILTYTKGLIELRKEIPALRYSTRKEINSGLRFAAERIPNSPQYVTRVGTRHKNWEAMEKLKLNFIGGPANSTLYIIGEVHGDQQHSKNPTDNKYAVEFDNDGYGSYSFTHEDIGNFDFKGWEDNDALNIKLVKTPGQWDFPEGSYTRLGNNEVTPDAVKKDKCTAKIDLSQINHIAGSDKLIHLGHIAYFLDNSASKDSYHTLLVVHNANDNYSDINLDGLADFKEFHILVDSNKAGITPITNSTVEIFGQRVKVPGKSCAVIGCLR